MESDTEEVLRAAVKDLSTHFQVNVYLVKTRHEYGLVYLEERHQEIHSIIPPRSLASLLHQLVLYYSQYSERMTHPDIFDRLAEICARYREREEHAERHGAAA